LKGNLKVKECKIAHKSQNDMISHISVCCSLHPRCRHFIGAGGIRTL